MRAMRAALAFALVAVASACGPRGSGAAEPEPRRPAGMAGFERFSYVGFPGLGYCPRVGRVAAAEIDRAGGGWRFAATVLEPVSEGAPVETRRARPLTPVEADEVLALFAQLDPHARALAGCPAPASSPSATRVDCAPGVHCYDFEEDTIESDDRCLLDRFRWDELEVGTEACGSSPHLSFEEGERVLALLDRLAR